MLNSFKTELSDLIHLSKDALHIHLGLGLFFLAVILLRKSPASLGPWLCVLGFEFVNEAMDMLHWYHGAWQFSLLGGLKDIANTMLWPTAILLGLRFTRVFDRTKPASVQAGSLQTDR